jgi:hypothetical protein
MEGPRPGLVRDVSTMREPNSLSDRSSEARSGGADRGRYVLNSVVGEFCAVVWFLLCCGTRTRSQLIAVLASACLSRLPTADATCAVSGARAGGAAAHLSVAWFAASPAARRATAQCTRPYCPRAHWQCRSLERLLNHDG